MPPLSNARHERFAQALFEGKSATDAHVEAGYKPCRKNAHRLTTKDDIRARLTELQLEAQKSAEVSVASLLAELEDARRRGLALNQIGSVVKSIEAKAKVSGLLTQKIEITDLSEFNRTDSYEDIADAIAHQYGVNLTISQRTEVTRLMLDWWQAIEDFLKPLAAKPVSALPARPVVDMERVERKRLGLTR